ncbi:uncharacterized protein LACBIDRAFT_313535 [Laccaria bicolor S238N-H82]|uniref:Predicted protein n=1 Tax=Laccaria bicolor (strain S238N-H82 / ATCC MYA-4686) TaxID=486041 RepID=B0D077_LACBS|nr:uncharacterized protein LACBIDRAFT_313535 [Laccaria bicolor S238N-H82]EDR11781.1 predicted protein [Laccaria bicolor S238N-H82]|eukprot:XP_001877678.1 predicted protein [Laccaria bicolor S238N-H82]
MSLSLNCLILGDDHSRTFVVKIPKNESISFLRDLIKEKKAPHLNHIAASDLDLWAVSIPIDHLQTELENINLADQQKLSPTKKLTSLEDVTDDHLHVIAKAPAIPLDSTQSVSLNCFVVSDDPSRTFVVKISKNESISFLRDLIKEKKAPHLNHIAAPDLDLWKVSIPIDNLPWDLQTLGPNLRSHSLVSDVFASALDTNHLHVIAKIHGKSYYDSHMILLIIPSRRGLRPLAQRDHRHLHSYQLYLPASYMRLGRRSAAAESQMLLQTVGNLKFSSKTKRPMDPFYVIDLKFALSHFL